MTKKLQYIPRIIVAMAVSLLVLAYLLDLLTAGVDAGDRPQLLTLLRNTLPLFVAGYFGLALLQAAIRAARYRILIAADSDGEVPGRYHTFLVTAVRNMLVDLLPARAGELSYISMMNLGCRVSGRTCVSSLAVSFVFDFVALFCLLWVILIYQGLTANVTAWLAWAAIVVLFVCGVMVLLLFTAIKPVVALTRRLLGKMAERKIVARVLDFGDEVADAVEKTRRGGVLKHVFLLSLGVRIVKYAALYLLFRAVTTGSYVSLSSAPLFGVLLAFLCAEGMASMPVPSFMSFGVYEAGGALALTSLGFKPGESAVTMLAIHILSQTVDYSFGGLAFILFLFRKRDQRQKEKLEARGSLAWLAVAAGALVLLLAGLGTAAWQYRKTRKLGALRPPKRGRAVVDRAGEDRRRAQIATLRGFMVWSSNRAGNHDIYMMTFPDGRMRRLTQHPHVESYPRISPDGKQVVFARGKEAWVSQRNYLPWSIYVVTVETGEERLIAESGNAPTWSEDGHTLYYQRNGSSLCAYDTRTKKETVVCDSEACGFDPRTLLETPSYDSRGRRLAVTLRGPQRATVVGVPGETFHRVGGGCQLTWGQGGQRLFYIDKGGRHVNAVYEVLQPDLTRRVWLDLPGDLSHEYFPRLSANGRYLVLGASTGGRGQHEHDTADYEIFLWEVGTPADNAVRMTFHTGNDCWPDIWLAP